MAQDTPHAQVSPFFKYNYLFLADINECDTGGCDPRTNCTNLPGSYSCSSCPSGYYGSTFNGTGYTPCTGKYCLFQFVIQFNVILAAYTTCSQCDPLVNCTKIGTGPTAHSMCGPCPAGYSGTGSTKCCTLDKEEN